MKKKFWKKYAAVTLTAVMAAAALTGCGGDKKEGEPAASGGTAEDSGDGKTYQIGVFQYTQHAALDEANEGFVAALEESGLDCEIDQQNASGDSSATLTIARRW